MNIMADIVACLTGTHDLELDAVESLMVDTYSISWLQRKRIYIGKLS